MQGVTKSRPTATTLTADAVMATAVAAETRVVVRTGTTVDRRYWRRRLSIPQTWYWCRTTGSRWSMWTRHRRHRWRHCRPEVTRLSGAWCNRHQTCWRPTCALKLAWSSNIPPRRTVPRQLSCAA